MRRSTALLVVVALAAVPIAGCVGSGGSSGQDVPDAPEGQTGDETGNATGNGSGDRPHVHDRWEDPSSGERVDQVSLVGREVQVNATEQDDPTVANQCSLPPAQQGPTLCLGEKTFFPGQWGDGSEKIVPPGTDRVEVTLDFSSSDFDKVRFFYQDRRSKGQWQKLGTFESGDTMTIKPVPVTKSDDGHAKVSAWRFHVEPEGNPRAAGDGVWYGDGPVQTTITAFRSEGELPIEPPHPDFWVETDTYRIGAMNGSVGAFTQANRVHVEDGGCGTSLAGTCLPTALNSQGVIWTVPTGYRARRLGEARTPAELGGPHDRALVPPEAVLLAGVVTIEGETTAPVEVCFRAMASPEEGPIGRPLGECETFDGGTLEMTATQALTERRLDSFYTDNTGHNASRWTFFIQISAQNVAGRDTTGSFSGDVEAEVFVTSRTEFQPPPWSSVAGGGTSGNSTGGEVISR